MMSLILGLSIMSSQNAEQKIAFSALPVVPSKAQVAWHEMETTAFFHFGPNTFTGNEWGKGTEDPNLFDPKELDCKQWCRVLKSAGFKGVIITAKHHDGFCLWPSRFSKHTIAQSAFRSGKADVLKELSAACKEYGLKLGVYLSPWDRNHPSYGTDAYNDTFKSMLKEVLTQYGPIFEVWFDGANGEGPNGKKQVYDWPAFISVVRKYQPQAVIFSDAGPDVRWVGNESGLAPDTCWATIDRDRYVPGTPLYQELGEGKMGGTHWVGAECDVSIRPGWFWRAAENDKVKSVDDLFSIYLQSVGHGAQLLLNVPPDTRGLIHENDVARLTAFRQRVQTTFAVDLARDKPGKASETLGRGYEVKNLFDGNPKSFWAAPQGVLKASLGVTLGTPKQVDYMVLAEPIAFGQRIKKFRVMADVDGAWSEIGAGTTVGYKRIIKVTRTQSTRFAVIIDDAVGNPALTTLSLYGP